MTGDPARPRRAAEAHRARSHRPTTRSTSCRSRTAPPRTSSPAGLPALVSNQVIPPSEVIPYPVLIGIAEDVAVDRQATARRVLKQKFILGLLQIESQISKRAAQDSCFECHARLPESPRANCSESQKLRPNCGDSMSGCPVTERIHWRRADDGAKALQRLVACATAQCAFDNCRSLFICHRWVRGNNEQGRKCCTNSSKRIAWS
jgi:hypothetical protein